MSDLTVVMQAKKDLYFRRRGRPNRLFMSKGEVRVMIGARTGCADYKYIEHNDTNFRFFIPIDMCKPKLL